MRRLVIGIMTGLLAFSPALAQQGPPPGQNPPPTPPPFICDPRSNPGTEVACWALVGATLALIGVIIAEGSQKDERPPPNTPKLR